MKLNKILFILFAALLIIGAPIAGFAQINVSAPVDLSGEAGETTVLPISVSDLTGEGYISYKFSAVLDSDILEITGYETNGTISNGATVEFNNDDKDSVVIGAQNGATPFAGNEPLVNLTVEFKKTGTTTIEYKNFTLDETPFTVNSTNVIVGAVDIFVDDYRGDADVEDVIEIEVTDDLTDKNLSSYYFTLTFDPAILEISGYDATDTRSADGSVQFNNTTAGQVVVGCQSGGTPFSGTGTLLKLNVKYLTQGTSALTFTHFDFDESEDLVTYNNATVYVGMVDVYMPTVEIQKGEDELVAITVDKDMTDYNVVSYLFDFTYDATEIEIKDVVTENTLSAGWSIQKADNVGTYTVGGNAQGTPLGAGDTLLLLEVNGLKLGDTDLKFNNFEFDEGAVSSMTNDGVITVVNFQAPEFSVVMPDTTILDTTSLTFTYEATDANNDVLTFALVDSIDGLTVSAEGVLAWEPTTELVGEHNVVVSVTDGKFIVNDTAVVTIEASIPTLTIAEAKVDEDGDFVPDLLGETVIVEGIVTTPSFSGSKYDICFQDNTAGIGFYGKSAVEINVNDKIKVTGTIGQYNGKTQINPLSENDIEIISTGNSVKPYTITNFSSIDPEALECRLVKIVGCEILNPADWPAEGDEASLDLEISKRDTITLRIDRDTELDGWDNSPRVWEGFNVTGVLDQFSYSDIKNDYYQLKPRYTTDFANRVDTDEPTNQVPSTYSLSQNYPNPFNPTTTISYALPMNSSVKLSVYNMLGKKVADLVNNTQSAGIHTTNWNAANMPSGVYFYKVEMQSISGQESFNTVRKMMLVK